MKIVKGAYSCLTLVMDVGIVAFRDPFGIRFDQLHSLRSARL